MSIEKLTTVFVESISTLLIVVSKHSFVDTVVLHPQLKLSSILSPGTRLPSSRLKVDVGDAPASNCVFTRSSFTYQSNCGDFVPVPLGFNELK